jgi:hypothetical protein
MTYGEDASYGRATVVAMQAIDYYRENADSFDSDSSVPTTTTDIDSTTVAREIVAELQDSDVELTHSDTESTNDDDSDGSDITLPNEGSRYRQALFSVFTAMRDKDDWVTVSDVRRRTNVVDSVIQCISPTANDYSHLLYSRPRSGAVNEYSLADSVYREFQSDSSMNVMENGHSE